MSVARFAWRRADVPFFQRMSHVCSLVDECFRKLRQWEPLVFRLPSFRERVAVDSAAAKCRQTCFKRTFLEIEGSADLKTSGWLRIRVPRAGRPARDR